MSSHKFCPRHRIAYNTDFDYTCPQCTLARLDAPEQLDFDKDAQKPLDASGNRLDPKTLKPV